MRRLTLRKFIEDDDWAGHAEFLVATHADVLDRREELDDIGYLLARWRPPTEMLVPLRDNEEQLLPAVLELLDGAEGSRRFHLLTALYAWDRGSLAPGSTRPRSLMDTHLEHCPLIVEDRRDLLAAGRRMSCYAGWKAFAEDEAVRACWKV
ncbi:hypothetical protein [Lentzea sp. NPDC051838]|uniref:hypothetical protein n=1 Tax=Lentzea sp. NPDC051838 TaxID=3154849 RepID=UPI0034468280